MTDSVFSVDGDAAPLAALGSVSQGGAALGPAAVIDHLVNEARTFIFDAGLAPAAAGALAALRLLRNQPRRAADARTTARALYKALDAASLSVTRPERCCGVGSFALFLRRFPLAAECRRRGLRVGGFRPPSVPEGISRLRLTARADLSQEDLARAVRIITDTAPADSRR